MNDDKSGAENVKSFEALANEAASICDPKPHNGKDFWSDTHVENAFLEGANWAREYFEAKQSTIVQQLQRMEAKLAEANALADEACAGRDQWRSTHLKLKAAEAKLNDAETKLACVLVHHGKLETQLAEQTALAAQWDDKYWSEFNRRAALTAASEALVEVAEKYTYIEDAKCGCEHCYVCDFTNALAAWKKNGIR